MEEKILTISIASYNVEKYLDKCLSSFIGTDVFDSLEIIIVNDGSKDGTLELAGKYVNEYPGVVRLIDKENGGHGSTINASIEAATGKYYKVVDADDWVSKEGFEKLVAFLKENDVDLVLNPYHYVDSVKLVPRFLRTPFEQNELVGQILPLAERKDDVFMEMHAMTYRTEIVKKMGPAIDENCFYVDVEYAMFPLEFVNTMVTLDFPVYQYLVGMSEQSVNSANMVKRRAQHLKVLKRIIEYYEAKKDSLSEKTRTIIAERLKGMAQTQYKILFRVEGKASKAEITEFDAWLKSVSPEIYKGTDEPVMDFVRGLRKTDFKAYGLFMLGMKIKWKLTGQSDII